MSPIPVFIPFFTEGDGLGILGRRHPDRVGSRDIQCGDASGRAIGQAWSGRHLHVGGRGPQTAVQLWEILGWLLATQGQGCSEEPALAGGGKPCSLPSSLIAGDDG